MPQDRRLLVIGLDAADRELIDQWCAQGFLENIARIREQGIWTSLDTTADVLHVSAWPSIFSGTVADKHGLYHAYVMQPGQQAPLRPRPDLCPVPFVWKVLDEHGKRCIVMDAFLTCPVQPFSGIQIVDWGSWTWFSEQTILPDGVKQELARKFGAYPAENHSMVGMTPPPDPMGFRERLLKAVEKKTQVVKWLAETKEWDFFLVVFGECHSSGHYFWHYQDSSYVAYPRECDARLRTALRDVYIALDRAIGECVKYADDRTTVLVVSGDGMGPNYSGSHLLGGLLERMRLLNDPGAGGAASAARAPSGKRGALSTLRGLVPKEFRAAVSRYLLPRSVNERLSLHWKTAGIDWARTRAFVIENANEGYVRLNLRGREPQGVVAPGAEYEDLCAQLASVSATMTNPANGRLAASSVHKTDDLFRGPCRPKMPDVVVNWDVGAEITTKLATVAHGVIESAQPGYGLTPYYTGNHRPNAFLGGVGPGVAAGQGPQSRSILDLAPTILAHFGIDPPAHMDGRALTGF